MKQKVLLGIGVIQKSQANMNIPVAIVFLSRISQHFIPCAVAELVLLHSSLSPYGRQKPSREGGTSNSRCTSICLLIFCIFSVDLL